MTKKALQWHPAFQAALQIEFMDEPCQLEFLKEFNLTEKPLQIDTLVIKPEPDKILSKSIGHIFRKYNIIEYKNPEDYFSINDYYRVTGYACIYQSNTEKEREIPPEELTISLAVSHYPRKLAAFLKYLYHADISQKYPGIYYVTGLMFPMQILILPRLSREEFTWLSRLRTNLSLQEDIEPLAKAYTGKEKNPLYEAAMDFIVRTNWKKYKEGRDMCNALEELFADKLEEREKIGMEQGIERGIEQGIRAFVLDHIEEGTPQNIILQKLEKRFFLSPEQAEEYFCRFREG